MVFVHIDADERKDLTSKYAVSGFPTLIMMKADASIVDQWSGYSPAPQFIERVKQALRKGGMSP
jgi:thioredoxin-related protein